VRRAGVTVGVQQGDSSCKKAVPKPGGHSPEAPVAPPEGWKANSFCAE